MHTRLTALLGATIFLVMTGSAHAADMAIDGGAVGCDCASSSSMIVVYDFQPGVVTRNWKDCDCRNEPAPRRIRPVSGLPAYAPQFGTMIEPWRR